MFHSQEDTIAAIATPPGVGALGIIRISGKDAIHLANLLFKGKDLEKVKPQTIHYGRLEKDDQILDEAVLSVFRAPHSYTGEDIVEISCHGSGFILQKIMEALVDSGIRPADAGEFTMRAFLNGKMDLSQAEAVADLIASESEAAHRTAILQMRGGFSGKIKDLRARLLHFASMVELELDFAEEDVEFANRNELSSLLQEIESEISRLAESFKWGNVLKEGVKVVIAGRPNAGKSTLLNCLLNEEKAIVSEIPGTTRDVIEDLITIEGIRFRFIDTAGIRATTDKLESIGISRTMSKIQEAQILLYLFDVSGSNRMELEKDLEKLPKDKKLLPIGNKIDGHKEEALQQKFKDIDNLIFISAKKHLHIERLRSRLIEVLDLPTRQTGDVVVTNVRHYNALKRASQSIQLAKKAIESCITTDLLAFEIRQALSALGEITGEITSDEILGTIFSKFCIGK